MLLKNVLAWWHWDNTINFAYLHNLLGMSLWLQFFCCYEKTWSIPHIEKVKMAENINWRERMRWGRDRALIEALERVENRRVTGQPQGRAGMIPQNLVATATEREKQEVGPLHGHAQALTICNLDQEVCLPEEEEAEASLLPLPPIPNSSL